jgi:hypothetical protein
LNQHEVDMPSVRTHVEHAPDTQAITRCTVSVKCTCGVEVSASAADMATATNQVTLLIFEHIDQANGKQPDQPGSLPGETSD